MVSSHGHREGQETEKGEEIFQAIKEVQTLAAKGELLERAGLQGTKGLVLPYLFGIRGDAANEEGMAPAKQQKQTSIILLCADLRRPHTILGAAISPVQGWHQNSISHLLSLVVRSCNDCWNLDTSVEV